MILPTKHVKVSQSLIGIGAQILQTLENNQSLTRLWDAVRQGSEGVTFERFVLALDFLFLIDCIEFGEGILRRKSRT